MFTLLLEGVEFGAMMYKGREGIDMIVLFVTTRLIISFFVLQFAIGAVTPILILSYMFWRGTTGRALVAGILVSALLVMFNVIMMRFNVVIGGQEISKTGKGLLAFPWEIFGREGLLDAVGVLIAPCLLLLAVVHVLPPWENGDAHDKALA
jgi:predicted membrane protein